MKFNHLLPWERENNLGHKGYFFCVTNGETSLVMIMRVIEKSLTIIPSVFSQLSNFLRHLEVPQVHI